LRPGTYDINTANYKNANYINLKNYRGSQLKYKKKILISKNKIKRIDKLIKIEKLKNLDFYKLIDYIKKSISMREYSKFIFTKNINLILNYVEQQGLKYKLSRNDLSFLDINFFLKKNKKTVNEVKKIINKKKDEFILTKTVKLPQIIHDSSGAFISPYQVNIPNFVTKNRVICESLFLNSKLKNIKINNKIIFIESADPGYDWLFTYKIKGLVTKFGGVNSHMAIRCRELNIPAAIGCGEKLFSDLMNSKKILLDCSRGKLDRIK
jgi:phosphohistidine swiveling domain-containing protein